MTRHLAGRDVFPIGYGAMPLSTKGRPDEATGVRTIHAALDAGMTLIDTADAYCLEAHEAGHNERLIAKALSSWSGERPMVATKGGILRPRGRWDHDGRPEHLRAACEASLRALGVECIDLYQLHAIDSAVPLEDSVGELARLSDEGKIAHVGVSNFSLSDIERAAAILPIASVQNRANPYAANGLTDGVLAYCEANDMAFIAYSPVGGRRAKRTAKEKPLSAIGDEVGATAFEVALAWLLAKSPSLIPIPGARRPENARSSARAASLELDEAHVTALDDAYLV